MASNDRDTSYGRPPTLNVTVSVVIVFRHYLLLGRSDEIIMSFLRIEPLFCSILVVRLEDRYFVSIGIGQ